MQMQIKWRARMGAAVAFEEDVMAERSFAKEVQQLRMGAGNRFYGEGILAITKALLENGVAYVGGYQGSPISHLMDVLADAEEILDELDVKFTASASEAQRHGKGWLMLSKIFWRPKNAFGLPQARKHGLRSSQLVPGRKKARRTRW